VRAFDAGVPSQIGIILSGILSLLGDRLLSNTTVFTMGMVVAGLCALVVWRMRPRYADALVAALRAGRIEVFSGGERIFAGLAGDLDARRILTTALDDPRPLNQQLAAEMLARSGAAASFPNLVERLPRVTPDVRAAFIRALGQMGAKGAAKPVAACLPDPSPAVRAAALEALPVLAEPNDPKIAAMIRPLLHDPEFSVRIPAAVSLAKCGGGNEAAAALLEFLDNTTEETATAAILNAYGLVLPCADQPASEAVEAIIRCLSDRSRVVRSAACRGLASVSTVPALKELAHCLSDPAAEVRSAAARALQSAGAVAIPFSLAELQSTPDPEIVLAALPAGDPAILSPLRDYARGELRQLREWREAGRALPPEGRAAAFLAALVEARASRAEQHFIKVMGLLGDENGMQLIARTLKGADQETRAIAVEALDTLGDKQLVKDFLPLLEDASTGNELRLVKNDETCRGIQRLIHEADPWVRALAIRTAGELELTGLIPEIQPWLTGPDEMTREAAFETLQQLGGAVDTLQTLSVVERTLLLREIPLFKDLSADDLVQLAHVAKERWFDDGAVVCRRGEIGAELFVIAAGQVRVTTQNNGQERQLAIRQTGEFIGEMAIIESAPRVATITAAGEVRTLVIGAAEFQAILLERPAVAMAVMRGLSSRLRELS
jgi:CRP-like cAMP-binding protein